MEVRQFIDAQNSLFEILIEKESEKQNLVDKLTSYWNYPKFSCPSRHGDRYYFLKNNGLQNQSVLYVQNTLEEEPIVFLDPNEFSEDGTIALIGTKFSDDGRFLAYGLSESGSDWVNIKIKDVESGKDFNDCLSHVKFMNVSWTLDGKGFFYTRYPITENKVDGSKTFANENQKLFYHNVGEMQDLDVLIAEFPEKPNWRLVPEVSHCGKYLLLYIMEGCKGMQLHFTILSKDTLLVMPIFTEVISDFESDFDYITNYKNVFTFRTNRGAENYQIVNIDLNKCCSFEDWNVLVKAHPKRVIDWCHCIDHDKIVICYIDDVKSILQVNSLQQGLELKIFELPIGTIVGFSGDKKYSEIFYLFVSFLTPGKIYRYDFAQNIQEPSVHVEIQLENFNSGQYSVQQLFFKSRDGERIPMFIVEKKSLKKRHPKCCLLYGYGGFNISILPTFSVTGIVFIDYFDGILAYPNIRGGGEYGDRWHNAGRLLNKQNSFNDFQDSASFLAMNGYTIFEKIGIQGGSNGGLLVGACINQVSIKSLTK